MQLKLVLILSFLALFSQSSFCQEAHGSFPNNKLVSSSHKIFELDDQILLFSSGFREFRFVYLDKLNLDLIEEIRIDKKPKDFDHLTLLGKTVINDTLTCLAKDKVKPVWYWITVDIRGKSFSIEKKELPKYLVEEEWQFVASMIISNNYFLIKANKKTDELRAIKVFRNGEYKVGTIKTGIPKLSREIQSRDKGFLGDQNEYEGNFIIGRLKRRDTGYSSLISLDSRSLEFSIQQVPLVLGSRKDRNLRVYYTSSSKSDANYLYQIIIGDGFLRINLLDWDTFQVVREEEILDKPKLTKLMGKSRTYSGKGIYKLSEADPFSYRSIRPNMSFEVLSLSKDSVLITLTDRVVAIGRPLLNINLHQLLISNNNDDITFIPTNDFYFQMPVFELIGYFYRNRLVDRVYGIGEMQLLIQYRIKKSVYTAYKHKGKVHILRSDYKVMKEDD
ncbi:MAG: hypothetical protein AAF388_18445 [Bacteroidota bacterium]